jgi:hypothetical protein
MSHDDNQDSAATPAPSGQPSAPVSEVPEETQVGPANPISQQQRAANGAKAQDPSRPKTSEGQGSSQTSPMEGLFAFRTLPPGETRESVWTEFRPTYVALWEQYQPETPIEVLLFDKIAANLIRFGRLLTFEARHSGDGYPLDPYQLARADSIYRNQAAVWRQFLQDIRELERVQQQRKAGTVKRQASKGQAEHNTVNEPDWTAVVPLDSAQERPYRQQLVSGAARAGNVETKPASSESGKPNGATAPKPVVRPQASPAGETKPAVSPAGSATPPAAGNGKESSTP